MSAEREALIDFANALEAAVVKLKHELGEPTHKENFSWNPSRIRWEPKQGAKGAYEQSDDVNNTEFKAMLEDLAKHDGKLTRDGVFYWIFTNGATVGRKKKR